MNIIYEYVNVSQSERLETLLQDKLEKLVKKYPFVIRADIFLKVDNKDFDEQKHCGIRLSCSGPRVYASSDEATFEASIKETIQDLEDQLEKRKSQSQNY